jgi:hypothetical protein
VEREVMVLTEEGEGRQEMKEREEGEVRDLREGFS